MDFLRFLEQDAPMPAGMGGQSPPPPAGNTPSPAPSPTPPDNATGEEPPVNTNNDQPVPDVEVPTIDAWGVLEKFVKENKGKKFKV